MKTLRVLSVAMIALSLVALPAGAEDEPRLDPITWYLHGNGDFGEADYLGDPFIMDLQEPGDGDAKSMGITNYAAGPNTNCSGNQLFPTWVGEVSDNITNLKVTLDVTGLPDSIFNVSLYADTGLGCNESAGPRLTSRQFIVTDPTGEITIDFGSKEYDIGYSLIMMVHPNSLDPLSHGRISYDSQAALSRVEFDCIVEEEEDVCDVF